MMLYFSRKIGWTLACLFAIIAVSLYLWPNTTKPIIGAVVSLGDQVTKNVLNIVAS